MTGWSLAGGVFVVTADTVDDSAFVCDSAFRRVFAGGVPVWRREHDRYRLHVRRLCGGRSNTLPLVV